MSCRTDFFLPLITDNCASHKTPSEHSLNAPRWLSMEQPHSFMPTSPCLITKAIAFHRCVHVTSGGNGQAVNMLWLLLTRVFAVVPLLSCRATLPSHNLLLRLTHWRWSHIWAINSSRPLLHFSLKSTWCWGAMTQRCHQKINQSVALEV